MSNFASSSGSQLSSLDTEAAHHREIAAVLRIRERRDEQAQASNGVLANTVMGLVYQRDADGAVDRGFTS